MRHLLVCSSLALALSACASQQEPSEEPQPAAPNQGNTPGTFEPGNSGLLPASNDGGTNNSGVSSNAADLTTTTTQEAALTSLTIPEDLISYLPDDLATLLPDDLAALIPEDVAKLLPEDLAALLAEVSPEDAITTATAIAEAVAASAEASFDECLTVEQSGQTVQWTFDNCSGPQGLVALNGTVAASYSINLDGRLQANVETDASVGPLSVTSTGTVTYQVVDGEQLLLVSSQGEGNSPLGGSASRVSDYTLGLRDDCLRIDGSTETTTGTRLAASLDFDSYEMCAGACPSAGGAIHARLGGISAEIAFDGSATAIWSAGQASGELPLPCTTE